MNVHWLAYALLALPLIYAAPNPTTSLQKRGGYSCLSQPQLPGISYAATVKTYHRFAGSTSYDWARGCFYASKEEAEAEVREWCQLNSDRDNGCDWSSAYFDTQTAPTSTNTCPWHRPGPTPAQGGCYQLKPNCVNVDCYTMSKKDCRNFGIPWYGCGYKEPPPPPVPTPVTEPGQPLHRYHSSCDSVGESRTPECFAAMHRYCMYTENFHVAIPQEVGTSDFGVLCAQHNFYDNVKYSKIPGCDGGNSQSSKCYSSTHRYCDNIGKGGVGIVQELGNGAAGVACVPYASYQAVKMTTLQAKHSDCNSPARAHSAACAAAVHRYCSDNGLGKGGVVAEVGADEVAVGCIADGKYVSMRV